jgi:hypothetical protein
VRRSIADGASSEAVMRRVERDLDLEEALVPSGDQFPA